MCLPLVGSRLYEWYDPKKGLTRAGLLMEVARNTILFGKNWVIRVVTIRADSD